MSRISDISVLLDLPADREEEPVGVFLTQGVHLALDGRQPLEAGVQIKVTRRGAPRGGNREGGDGGGRRKDHGRE